MNGVKYDIYSYYYVKFVGITTKDIFYFGYDSLFEPFNYKTPSSPFPGWAIALIVILVLVVVGGGAFIGYNFLAKKNIQLKDNVEKTSFFGSGESNKNLLTNELENNLNPVV